MIDSFSSQIKVAVRVRPILACDYKLARQKGIKSEVCVAPKSDGETIALVKDVYHSKDFHYSQVFGHLETQQDVYEKGCQQLVAEFTNGYNACLLCYGQSGTGKTYTMFGSNAKNWNSDCKDNITGIMQHSLKDIFKYIDICRADNKTAKLYVSFYEIYLECVRDLLIPSKVRGQKVNLNIRECPERGTYIEGLSIFEVEDFDSLYELIHKAVARRASGAQKINATSSRSHAIVRLVLEHEADVLDEDTESIHSIDENPILSIIGGKGKVRKNIFTFGDLAGSERLSKSGASSGAQLKESQNINKSISALGNCVQALAYASNKREKGGISASHIPFRDSKLTRLLADALSGNTKTYFISTVGPSIHSYTETLSTLTFASRAASVKKIVVKEKATKDVFTDLSREMFDWQWPAVYKKAEAKQKVPIDDTDWAYDTKEDELGKSNLSSKTLTMNDFLTKCAPDPAPVIPTIQKKEQGEGGEDHSRSHNNNSVADITIFQNDLGSHAPISGEGGGSLYPHTSHWEPNYSPPAEQKTQPQPQQLLTPDPLGNNALLFELASEVKDFNSVYRPQSNSPHDYRDEEKTWSPDGKDGRSSPEDFLDTNLYLSFPPTETDTDTHSNTHAAISLRKAPPIPTLRDEMIRYDTEKPILKSALKAAPQPHKEPVDTSIIDELDNLSGEINSFRAKLTEMESKAGSLLPSSPHPQDEMQEICVRDLATSTDDTNHSTVHVNAEHNYPCGSKDVLPSSVSDHYEDNVLFTVDGEGNSSSSLQHLERSIISCGNEDGDGDDGDGDGDGDAGGDSFTPRDHTLLPDFSLQDFDDELDKINLENGLNLPLPPPCSRISTPSKNRKKEIRFDLKSTPSYDSSEIIDISLNYSSMKRHRLPPPPPSRHPNTVPPCDECEGLQKQVTLLEDTVQEKKNEIYLLKEFIRLNDLHVPAVSVKDDNSGVFF